MVNKQIQIIPKMDVHTRELDEDDDDKWVMPKKSGGFEMKRPYRKMRMSKKKNYKFRSQLYKATLNLKDAEFKQSLLEQADNDNNSNGKNKDDDEDDGDIYDEKGKKEEVKGVKL